MKVFLVSCDFFISAKNKLIDSYGYRRWHKMTCSQTKIARNIFSLSPFLNVMELSSILQVTYSQGRTGHIVEMAFSNGKGGVRWNVSEIIFYGIKSARRKEPFFRSSNFHPDPSDPVRPCIFQSHFIYSSHALTTPNRENILGLYADALSRIS